VAPRESDTLGQAATYLMQQQEQTR
jgi:hypothetical protein